MPRTRTDIRTIFERYFSQPTYVKTSLRSRLKALLRSNVSEPTLQDIHAEGCLEYWYTSEGCVEHWYTSENRRLHEQNVQLKRNI